MEQVYDIPHITEIAFVSSEEALEQFREGLDDSAHILDGLENDNPLPASLVLDLDNISNWDTVEGHLNELEDSGIEVARNGRSAATALTTINNVLRVISSMIIVGLGIISLVIIFNTIRIAVNNRKIEISIMKYVGATDAFIRGPFIIEGMIIGILGAAVPLGIVYALYIPALDILQETLPVMEFYFRSQADILQLLTPLLLIIGTLIGIIGSSVSIRRYLNV
jgi:cell division transport system permease protein